MSAITAVPWHVYLTITAFAATTAALIAFELHDARPASAPRLRRGVATSGPSTLFPMVTKSHTRNDDQEVARRLRSLGH